MPTYEKESYLLRVTRNYEKIEEFILKQMQDTKNQNFEKIQNGGQFNSQKNSFLQISMEYF